MDYSVNGERGLRLRVTADKSGNVSKVWSLLYTRKSDGRRCRITLGEYPTMSLAKACEQSGAIRNEVRTGSDPAKAAREEKQSLTFEKLAQRWLDRYAKKNRRSWSESDRVLRRDVFPAIGAMKAEAVTKRDVIACADAILDRGAPVLANRVQSLVGSIYAWGASEDLVEKNPTFGLRKRAVETSRDRHLSAKEICRFWDCLDGAKMHEGTADILRLCLLLGLRVNEVAQAAKAEIDLSAGIWTIPSERTKNRRAHRLPIPAVSLAIIKRAFARQTHSRYLFPSPAKVTDEIMSNKAATKAWVRSRGTAELDNTVHDLRRTFASVAGELGFDDFHIGLVLNHLGERSKVTSIYNRAQYDPQKRSVLEAVERRLFEFIENPEQGAPVPLRSVLHRVSRRRG